MRTYCVILLLIILSFGTASCRSAKSAASAVQSSVALAEVVSHGRVINLSDSLFLNAVLSIDSAEIILSPATADTLTRHPAGRIRASGITLSASGRSLTHASVTDTASAVINVTSNAREEAYSRSDTTADASLPIRPLLIPAIIILILILISRNPPSSRY